MYSGNIKTNEFYRMFEIFDSKDCDCITPISLSILDSDSRFAAALGAFTGAGGATKQIYINLHLINQMYMLSRASWQFEDNIHHWSHS